MNNKDYLTGRLFKKCNNLDIAIEHFYRGAMDCDFNSLIEFGKAVYEEQDLCVLPPPISDDNKNKTNKIIKNYEDMNTPESLYFLGKIYDGDILRKYSESKSKHWYKKAAILGHAESQYIIGRVKQYTIDIIWLTKAANQGHVEARHSLACHYAFVIKDYKEACLWWNRAGRQGHAMAKQWAKEYKDY